MGVIEGLHIRHLIASELFLSGQCVAIGMVRTEKDAPIGFRRDRAGLGSLDIDIAHQIGAHALELAVIEIRTLGDIGQKRDGIRSVLTQHAGGEAGRMASHTDIDGATHGGNLGSDFLAGAPPCAFFHHRAGQVREPGLGAIIKIGGPDLKRQIHRRRQAEGDEGHFQPVIERETAGFRQFKGNRVTNGRLLARLLCLGEAWQEGEAGSRQGHLEKSNGHLSHSFRGPGHSVPSSSARRTSSTVRLVGRR